MGLILRTTTAYDPNPTLTVKNSQLTFEQGDNNFMFLLNNMSGSNITITGPTTITGNSTINGTLLVTGLITGTITNANNAVTASYILSSGVSGPHGMNSILSASYAISASYAPNAGGVEGGTTNYIPLWASANTLTISNMYQLGSNIGIGTTTPSHNLEVNGTVAFPSLITTSPLTQVVMWDQSDGRLYYTASTAIAGTFAPGGTNSQIQFNDNGVFGGVPTLTYTGSLLRATGSFTGSFSGSLFGTASWAISASRAITASFALSSSTAISSSFALSASRAITASFALSSSIAISSSFALSASRAITTDTASYILSSGVYGPFGLDSITSASYASGSTSSSFARTASLALTASYAQVSLQQVTTIGSSSVDDIFVGGVKIRSGSTVVTTLDYISGNGGRIILKEPNDSLTVSITAPTLTQNRNIEIPDGNGVVALSVNGFTANSAGAITIPTTAGNLSGSGEPKYLAYWSSSTATLGDTTVVFDDINNRVGINTGNSIPSGTLSVSGTVFFHSLEESLQINFVAFDSSSGQLYYFSTASWAANANVLSSSYASSSTFATTASYASSSTSASYALTASYTDFALSASYASSSTSASYANFALSSSYASSSTSASYAGTASFVVSALTASYVNPLTQSVIITGSLTLSGSAITIGIPSAQTNYVLTSTNTSGNATWQAAGATFPYTGSAIISGSLGITGSISLLSGSLIGTASWATSSLTSSYPVWVTGSTIYSTGPLSISNPNPAGNIFFGSGSGATRVTESIFLGKQTGQNAVSASNSILIGTKAGFASVEGNTIGTNNIVIGTNITLPENISNGINIGGLIFGTGSYSGSNVSSNPAGGRVGINITSPLFNFHSSGTVAFPSLGTTTNVTNVIMWSGSTGQLFVTASSALRPDSASYALSSSVAISASFALSSSRAISSSYALTASYIASAPAVAFSLSNGASPSGLTTFTYNGSQDVFIAVSGAINLGNNVNVITKWTGDAFAPSSITDTGTLITGGSSIQLTGTDSKLSGSFSGSFIGTVSTASQVENGRARYITLWESATRLTSSRTVYEDTSGRIGIGTTSPGTSFRLDVSQSARIDNLWVGTADNFTSGAIYFGGDAFGGLANAKIYSNGYDIYHRTATNASRGHFFVDRNNTTRAIIGQTYQDPNAAFTVFESGSTLSGDTEPVPTLRSFRVYTNGAVAVGNADNTYRLNISGSNSAGVLNANNVLYVSGSNVGINKSNPGYNLEASGTISFPNLTLSSQPHFVSYNSASGQLFYTSTSSFTAATASFVTASNVWGPFGSNSIQSASYASGSTSASFAATASYVPTMKGGSASAASFGGNPLTSSTITFGTAFPNNSYAITVTGDDARSWTIQNKVSGSFVINSNSVITLTGPVYWIAVPFNS